MLTSYGGKPFTGFQAVFIALRERFEGDDPNVTRETFIQLQKDLDEFRAKYATAGFMEKHPLGGPSARLGFPPISTAEALAITSKIRMTLQG